MNTTTTPYRPAGERKCSECGSTQQQDHSIRYCAAFCVEGGLKYADLCLGCLESTPQCLPAYHYPIIAFE